MKKLKTNWTTVSDKKTQNKINNEDVQNKLFWGVGFVVVLVFTGVLLAPNQILSVLKGDLFDGTGLGVIPTEESNSEVDDIQDDDVSEDLEDTQEEDLPENAVSETEEEIVVEAQTDAVEIQIDPIIVG